MLLASSTFQALVVLFCFLDSFAFREREILYGLVKNIFCIVLTNFQHKMF